MTMGTFGQTNWSLCPMERRHELRAYINEGVPLTTQFLQHLICNDFVLAYRDGSPNDRNALQLYASFLYHELPPKSWGSQAKMVAWLLNKKKDDFDEPKDWHEYH